MVMGDEKWILYNNVEWNMGQEKWTTTNHTKDRSLFKEGDVVYMVGLEVSPLLWAPAQNQTITSNSTAPS